MKNREEIIGYLGLEEDFEDLEEIINIAIGIENQYYTQLENGWYGYALSGDLEVEGRLEDSIYKLEQVEKIDDIVVYRKTLDFIEISNVASYYHTQDLLDELEYYKSLAKTDKRIKLLFDEATKETCKDFDINYDDYINDNVDWVMENCSDEFLLDLVNNIADWLGIDNHLYL